MHVCILACILIMPDDRDANGRERVVNFFQFGILLIQKPGEPCKSEIV